MGRERYELGFRWHNTHAHQPCQLTLVAWCCHHSSLGFLQEIKESSMYFQYLVTSSLMEVSLSLAFLSSAPGPLLVLAAPSNCIFPRSSFSTFRSERIPTVSQSSRVSPSHLSTILKGFSRLSMSNITTGTGPTPPSHLLSRKH